MIMSSIEADGRLIVTVEVLGFTTKKLSDEALKVPVIVVIAGA